MEAVDRQGHQGSTWGLSAKNWTEVDTRLGARARHGGPGRWKPGGKVGSGLGLRSPSSGSFYVP